MIRHLLQLASKLDENEQYDVADQVDDVVEQVGRMFLRGHDTMDIASQMGKSPGWVGRPLTRFWARYPELEQQHAPRGLSTDWKMIQEIGEAAELGFTFQQIRELLDIDVSDPTMSRYYLLFRERFPHLSKLGRPTISTRSTPIMTTEQAEQMSDQVAEGRIGRGMTFPAIAKELGITPDHAKELFYRQYVPRHPEHTPIKKDIKQKVQRMFEMYVSGEPLATISSELGYSSPAAVWQTLITSLPLEQIPTLLENRRMHEPDEVARIQRDAKTTAEMRLQFKGWDEIARTLNVSPRTAQRYERIATAFDPSLLQKLKDTNVIMKRHSPHQQRSQ